MVQVMQNIQCTMNWNWKYNESLNNIMHTAKLPHKIHLLIGFCSYYSEAFMFHIVLNCVNVWYIWCICLCLCLHNMRHLTWVVDSIQKLYWARTDHTSHMKEKSRREDGQREERVFLKHTEWWWRDLQKWHRWPTGHEEIFPQN